MADTDTTSARLEAGQPTPEEYASFIGQIELRNVWLRSARLINHRGPDHPEHLAIEIDSQAEYDLLPTGFRGTHIYTLHVESETERQLEMEVAFALDFDSKQSMTDAIFAVFAEVNLPVNSWPYLREYVSTAMARMGWLPITLPALKWGTARRQAVESSPAQPQKRRTPRAKKAVDSPAP